MPEVTVTDVEAQAYGVRQGDLKWGPKLRPLMMSKGVPAHWLLDGSTLVRPRVDPFNGRWVRSPEDDGFIFLVGKADG